MRPRHLTFNEPPTTEPEPTKPAKPAKPAKKAKKAKSDELIRPRHLTFNEPPTTEPEPIIKEIMEQVFPPKRKLPRHLDFAKKYPEQKKQSETVEEPETVEVSEEPEEPDKPSFKGRPRHLDFTRKYKKKVEENRPRVREERVTYPVSLPIYRMLMPQSSKKGVKVKVTEETLLPRVRKLYQEYYEEVGEVKYPSNKVFKNLKEYKKIGERSIDNHENIRARFVELTNLFVGYNRFLNLSINQKRKYVKVRSIMEAYSDFVNSPITETGNYTDEALKTLEGVVEAEERLLSRFQDLENYEYTGGDNEVPDIVSIEPAAEPSPSRQKLDRLETTKSIRMQRESAEPESEEFIRKRWSPEDEDFEPEQRAVSIFIPADDPRITEI